jgi:hypothetical protein
MQKNGHNFWKKSPRFSKDHAKMGKNSLEAFQRIMQKNGRNDLLLYQVISPEKSPRIL